jgi:hypothetical protein
MKIKRRVLPETSKQAISALYGLVLHLLSKKKVDSKLMSRRHRAQGKFVIAEMEVRHT